MRFAAVPRTPQQPLARVPAQQAMRRAADGPPAARVPAAPVKLVDLPADLDQRVRLIGEW